MQKSINWYYFTLLVCAYICSFFLLSLDKDVHSVWDLIHWKAILPISMYALPSFILSSLAFKWLTTRIGKMLSLFLSGIIGIPVGLISVVVFFKLVT